MSIYTDGFLQRQCLVDMNPFNVGTQAEEKLYIGTHYFTTAPGDSPANELYYGVVESGITYDRSMFSGENIGGRSIPSRGAISVAMPDSPAWCRKDMLNYIDPAQYLWDGRPYVVWIKEAGGAYTDKAQIYSGVIEELNWDRMRMIFSIRDGSFLFDKPIQETLYLGTGAREGGPELTGYPKPRALGQCFNVSAVYLNTSLEYQVNDGEIEDVTAVRDNGVPLLTSGTADGGSTTTLSMPIIITSGYDTAATPSITNDYYVGCELRIVAGTGVGQSAIITDYDGGTQVLTFAALGTALDNTSEFELDEFVKENTAGIFTLLATPAGRITADVLGAVTSQGYTAYAGGLLRYVAVELAGLDPALTVPGTFTNLDATRPWALGFYTGTDEANCLDVMDAIAEAVLGFYGLNRLGLFDCGAFQDPSADASVLSVDTNDLERGRSQREKFAAVVYSQTVSYAKNWTTQSPGELAGSVPEDKKQVYGLDFSTTEAITDNGVLTRNALATKRDYVSMLALEADAEALRDLLFDLFSVRRDIYSIPVKAQALSSEINDVITVTDTRLNLPGTRKGRIIRIEEDALKADTMLTVFV